MIQPKYSPEEALQAIKLRMNYDSSKTLNENLDVLKPQSTSVELNDYVFDFVITENKKYVIYMDEVFSGGKLIGNIWENTWVITEIIKESLMSTAPVDMLREEASKTVEFVLEGIEWTKETVSQIIKEYHTSGVILEQTYNPFNKDFWSTKNASKIGTQAVSKTKEIGKKALSIGKEYASKLLMGAFVPALRWIRKNSMTAIGTVVDVVTAMIPVTAGANKLVWVMIVILDMWEIKTKNYDPKDPDRASNPYMFLVTDLISLAFTAAAGSATKVGLQQGIKRAPSSTVKMLKALLEKMPWLKNTIKSFGDLIIKYIPKAKPVIDSVLGFIDNILINVEKFISQLFSKKGATAVASGLVAGWFVKQRKLSKGSTGTDVGLLNNFFKSGLYNDAFTKVEPKCQEIDPKTIDGGNTFNENTLNAVKILQACFVKNGVEVEKIGVVDGAQLTAIGVTMDESGIMKLIPQKAKEKIMSTLLSATKLIAQSAGDKEEVEKIQDRIDKTSK
jgi:hypothetical protein